MEVLSERVDNLEKDVCDVIKQSDENHDSVTTEKVQLDLVMRRQEEVIKQLAAEQIKLENMATRLDSYIDLGARIDKLELDAAVEGSEEKSFISSHINMILSLVVVGLVTTILMIIYYSVH